MNLLMTYQVAVLCESLVAGWTGIRTFTAVRTQMLGVGRVFCEGSGTVSTYVWFFACVMRTCVRSVDLWLNALSQ